MWNLLSLLGTSIYRLRLSSTGHQSNADTSSLMASGRVVYLAMYSQSKLPGSMWALRSNDGAILWRFQTGDAIGASFSEIRNGMMYINSTSGGDQNVSALRISDGALVWHYTIPHDQAPLFLTALLLMG